MKEKKYPKTKYKKLEKSCLECIENNDIVFFDEIFLNYEIKPTEFYSLNLNKSDELNNAIQINRSKLKKELREKWKDSTNATLNVALYKLICTEEERKLLSSSTSTKNQQNESLCTQEEYLKSLREMGESLEGIENAN